MAYKVRTMNDVQELVEKSAQKFNTHEIYHIKAGKKINNYDFIQENNVDTDIYQTLEKYGTLKPIQIDAQQIANEFETMDLRDLYNYKEKANTMWLNLPLEVRREFDNDVTNFMQNGQKWINNKIAKAQEEQKPVEQPKENEENGQK